MKPYLSYCLTDAGVTEATGYHVSKGKGNSPANKRRKQSKFIPLIDLEGYLQDLKAQGAAAHMATNNNFSWEARENQHVAMLARRREEHEKMLRQRSKELDEVYDRRRRELDADKEAFAAKEQRLAADIAKYMEKMEAFQNKVEAFQDERVRLFGENQSLASKLEAYNVSDIKTH